MKKEPFYFCENLINSPLPNPKKIPATLHNAVVILILEHISEIFLP